MTVAKRLTVVRRAGSDERGENDASNELTVVVEEVAIGAAQQHESSKINGRAVGSDILKKMKRERMKASERARKIEEK